MIFRVRTLPSLFLASLAVPITAGAQVNESAASPFGVLVMAHGGTPEWDQAIADATAPLASEIPTEIAYGMADPATLAQARARA